jgi:hypothetical protein
MTTTLKFQDPPKNPKRINAALEGILPELDKRPGEWALIRENSWASTVTDWRRRYPDYDFTGAATGDGRRYNIYGRRRA